jgi:hypothetical protein
MTITEFLTARYDSDEDLWTKARDRGLLIRLRDQPEVMSHDGFPAMMLADLTAKRAITKMHTPQADCDGKDECGACSFHELYEGFNDVSEPWPCLTLRLLAHVYADHADFDPAWRVE